jgi:hypothetical protein
MTKITLQGGKAVLRDGKVGTEQECCCPQCVCGDCPENLGFSVTFYGTRDGTLTFTHPYTPPGGSASIALCDRAGDSTSYLLGLVHDEALAFGFGNIASASISFTCGPSVDGVGRSWYVSVTGRILVNAQGDQVAYAYEGIVDFCDSDGFPVIDTSVLGVEYCTDEATGLPLNPCPIRVTASITT